jgi:hypothetical protein
MGTGSVSGAFGAAAVVLVPGVVLQGLQLPGMPLWGTAWALAVLARLPGHWRLWWMLWWSAWLWQLEPLPDIGVVALPAGVAATACVAWRRYLTWWEGLCLGSAFLVLDRGLAWRGSALHWHEGWLTLGVMLLCMWVLPKDLARSPGDTHDTGRFCD